MLPESIRGLLATTFLLSGCLKLIDRSAFQMALSALGLEIRFLRTALGWLVPILEITLGLMLVLGWQAQLAASGAVLLLVAFTLLLSIQLARGRLFSCRCFGLLSDGTTTWWDVGRNLVLIAVAALVLLFGHGATLLTLGSLTMGALALGVLLLALRLGQQITSMF